MAQSVSNDALWEKLSEIDKKLNKLSEAQKSPVPSQEPEENNPDFNEVKEEIITKIEEQTGLLGKHSDIHFNANKQNIKVLNENILKVLNVASWIRKHQKESVESQKEDKGSCFNLRLFKVRKTHVVITLLSLLVFTLILFCMKQQNDYVLLTGEYYRQTITIQKRDKEIKR